MKKENWRIIETGFHDAYFNMAVDEVLMKEKEQDKIPSTIRFYGWRPAAFSLGYIQDMEAEINFEVLQNLGLDCTSRITGGGILFHDREVTYSLSLGPDSHLFSHSVGESFCRLCGGIIRFIELLGFKAKFARETFSAIKNTGAFCFTANSSYDILVENKKLGGNAQRRKKKVILQHGSIPLELDLERALPALRNFSREPVKITSLRDILNKSLSFEEALLILKIGFRQGLGIELEPAELSREEMSMAQANAEEKREKFLKLARGEICIRK